MNERRFEQLFYLVVGSFIVFYGLQAFSPLRLTTDGIVYLSLADAAMTKGIHATLSESSPFPKGYPVFVYLLMKARLFSAASLLLSNLLFFVLGLVFSFRTLVNLGFERRPSLVACLLPLASLAAIKHVTQGMSDFLFFALSSCACWLMTISSPYRWLGIVPCVAIAIEVRFIGLALIIPLAVSAWPEVRKRPSFVAIASLLIGAGIFAAVTSGHHYLQANSTMLLRNGLWRFITRNLIVHCQDFGEMVWNLPFSKVSEWSRVPQLLTGSLAIFLFFFGIAQLWSRFQWLSLYLIAYSALIFPWPYSDPRFWLPAMPFVFLSMHEGLKAVFRAVPTRVVMAYVVVFCVVGLIELGYSTRITFAGPAFAHRYGDGRLTAAYLARCSPSPADSNQAQAVHLLREYEWHCRETQ